MQTRRTAILYCIKLAGSELQTHASFQLQFNRIKETGLPIKSWNLPQPTPLKRTRFWHVHTYGSNSGVLLILSIKLSLLVFNIFCRPSGSGDTEELAV